MHRPHAHRLVRAFVVSVLAGVALYAGSVALGDVHAVGEAMGALGTAGWAGVLGLSLANYPA
jgi:hypothetical protein